MNIFPLHAHPMLAAAMHCDVHVISQCKEAAQILCYALGILGIWDDSFAPLNAASGPHMKHPCCLWAAASPANFVWLYNLAMSLNIEYVRRSEGGAWPTQAKSQRGSDHKSSFAAMHAMDVFSRHRHERLPMTAWVQAMPEQYREPVTGDEPVSSNVGDAHPSIMAYRRYYRCDKGWLKNRPIKWSTRDVPGWWSDEPNITGTKDIFDPDPWEEM